MSTTTATAEINHARANATGHAQTMCAMFAACQRLDAHDTDTETIDGEEFTSREDIEDRAREAALCIELRSGWTSPSEPLTAAEFAVTLTTGGPALRMVGELENDQPTGARLEYQDWGTRWTEYRPGDDAATDDYNDALDWFAGLFYFEC